MSCCISPTHAQPAFFRAGWSFEQWRGSLLEFGGNACRSCGSLPRSSSLRDRTFISDEWQRSVLLRGKKSGHGVCHSGEAADLKLQSGEAEDILGLGCPWKKEITLVVFSHRKRYRNLTRFDRGYSKGGLFGGLGKWRSEFSEATEERRFTDFKSVNAPANFVCCKPQNQGSQPGKPKQEVRGQHDDDLTTVTTSSNGPAVSTELDGVRRVKVIGAGAGAPAILDFCQQSSLLPSAQFWYSSDAASEFILLPNYVGGSNSTSNEFETEGNKDPLITQDDNEETVFLVLGVGTGTGLGFVPGQLKTVRSKGSLAVGIFIQPFTFEGPKRLAQANQLIDDLLKWTDMLLVVEQDGLLRSDVVTVSEASSIAKNAVLLSIKAIIDLISGGADLFLNATVEGSSAISDDIKKILKNAGKAWLGSGRGNNSKEAIEMAVAEAPISDYDPFGAKWLVLCTLASALDPSKEEVRASASILHEALGPELHLVMSTVKNPMMENGLKLATIIITRLNFMQVTNGQYSNKNVDEYGMPSMIGMNTVNHKVSSQQIAHDSIIGAPNGSNFSQYGSSQVKASSRVSEASIVPPPVVSDNGSSSTTQETSTGWNQISISGNDWNSSPQKPNRPHPNKATRKKSSVLSYRSPSREDVKNLDAGQTPPQASLASTVSQKLRLAWEAGPSSDAAEAWAQARAEARKPTQVTSALDVSLPVGVRLDEEQGQQTSSENSAFNTTFEVAEDKWIGTEAVPVDPDALPRNRMMDMGLEAVRDMYNAASALVMGREMPDDRRQASLSQRAASMLESERSQKKLTPLVEMGFKNGIYKGRCQKGLPEGKGRLSFSDGSFYDGKWKQGKRTGSGAFYYTNGDMFQGSWKDDVMHGKGWMYYHNGDRLYANFWRGKADGEGRFYSAQGDVFFGQFRENWRHGEFLYIDASGVRWSEVWDNGILHSRTPANS